MQPSTMAVGWKEELSLSFAGHLGLSSIPMPGPAGCGPTP
jgi:hypothetical protein